MVGGEFEEFMADQPAFYTFNPRPDQPERFDEQAAFVESNLPGTAWLVGGNGSGTTELSIHKVARFILEKQPPPRRDTPFWIISDTYEQVCEMWAEKLNGHGHIPNQEVDWDRVSWYRPNNNWPFRVPLKPWPNRPGKNWTLEFKSYEQGRSKMQARAIGGFCFIEQFPWGIYEEVLRGCREYNFPGSKICEFTPVDPVMSARLEEMVENGHEPDDGTADPSRMYLPVGDRVFRCNTECALEAGHIQESWFNQFFGMISPEMRETRMTGEFATYEGAIYQSFNSRIHLVDDDVIFPRNGNFPLNVQHRRAIDWGAGPDNAQVCLWGYRNGRGQWFIYDEYWSTDQEMTVPDHLAQIALKWPWPSSKPEFGITYADPSSADCIRIAQRFNSIYPEFNNFSMQGARNAVYEGIDHVRWLLQPVPALDNQPRLFIHRKNCPNLAREMRTYRWLRGTDSKKNPRDARPEPLKKDDHAVDALRYLLFSEALHTGATPASVTRESPAASRSVRLEGRRRRWR